MVSCCSSSGVSVCGGKRVTSDQVGWVACWGVAKRVRLGVGGPLASRFPFRTPSGFPSDQNVALDVLGPNQGRFDA